MTIVRLAADAYIALTHGIEEYCNSPKTEAALRHLVLAGLARQSQPYLPNDKCGYVWKGLFLPNGSLLRCSFRGQVSYALVDDSRIVCHGKFCSPSGFANLSGCGNRNAWDVIWLRLPNEDVWRRARDCRPSRPVRAKRKAPRLTF